MRDTYGHGYPSNGRPTNGPSGMKELWNLENNERADVNGKADADDIVQNPYDCNSTPTQTDYDRVHLSTHSRGSEDSNAISNGGSKNDNIPNAVTVHVTAPPIHGARAIQNKARKVALQKLFRRRIKEVYKESSRHFVTSKVSGGLSASSGYAACYHSHCYSESTLGVENLKLLIKTTASVASIKCDSEIASHGNNGATGDNLDAPPKDLKSNLTEGISFASSIPSAFPKELTYRALAAYTTLRTLSLTLRISPFTSFAFLRALSLPSDCPFLNQIHVQILRTLYASREIGHYEARGDGLSRIRLQIPMGGSKKREESIVSEYLARKDNNQFVHGGENLTLMNQYTWPIFYMDYYNMFGPSFDYEDVGDKFLDRDGNLISSKDGNVQDENGSTLPKLVEDMDENALGIHTSEMDALFQCQPSDIPISQCDTPYKDYPWMSSKATEVEDATNEKSNFLSSKTVSAKGKGRAKNSRRKKRKKNYDGGDSSGNDSEDDSVYTSYHGSKRKRKRDSVAIDEKESTMQRCVSEKNPRPVSKRVYANIYGFLNNGDASNKEPTSDPDVTNSNEGIRENSNEEDTDNIDSKRKTEAFLHESPKAMRHNSTKRLDKSHDVQMKALTLLEEGKSHYNLDAEHRLIIIEFLIDELLDVEHVRNELESRMHKTADLKVYESNCDPEDSNNLVNDEECAISGLQGNLLHCGTCPSSYQRVCVGMNSYREFKDSEKWKCYECEIPDPTKVGSLFGGRKCSLDWFTLKDIIPPVDDPSLKDDDVDMLENVDFLIIQGYVFLRDSISKCNVDVVNLLSGKEDLNKIASIEGDAPHISATSPMPLNKMELFYLLRHLGPQICERWPFSQIPFTASSIWEHSTGKCHSSSEASKFFSSVPRAYNLFLSASENKYEKSPASTLVANHVGKKNLHLRGQSILLDSNPCLHSLSSNTTNDGYIRELMNSYGSDHVSMHCVRTYMMTLERTLLRSSLLHELWGLRNPSLEPELWGRTVSICNSFKDLAKLLVRLVDDTHSRAFLEEWHLVPGASSEEFTRYEKENRVYADLPKEWRAEEEKKRRNWEKSLASDVPGLLAKESKGTIAKSCRKGKGKKISKNASGISKLKGERFNAPNTSESEEVGERKNRRRGREGLTRNAAKVNLVKPLKDLEGADTDTIRDALLFRLECSLDDNFEEEGHWPVAGRRLFAPSGSLPSPTVKWLARNAGGKRAPGILYTDRFEIGLPSVNMIWRTKTLACKSLADLIYSLQFLDSYLSKNVMMSCEKLSSRTGLKEHIQKSITCSRYDQESGAVEHFVIHKNKWRGCWQNEASVDSSAFIVFRSCRIKDARHKFSKKVRSCVDSDESSSLEWAKVHGIRELRQRRAESVMFKVLQQNIDEAVAPILEQHKKYASLIVEKANREGAHALPTGVLKKWQTRQFDLIKATYRKYGNIGMNLFAKSDVAIKLVDAEKTITKDFKPTSQPKGIGAKPLEREHSSALYPAETERSSAPNIYSGRTDYEHKISGLNSGVGFVARPKEPRSTPVHEYPLVTNQSRRPHIPEDFLQTNQAYSAPHSVNNAEIRSKPSQYAQHQSHLNNHHHSNGHRHNNTNGYEQNSLTMPNGRDIPQSHGATTYGLEQTSFTYGSSNHSNNYGSSESRTAPSVPNHRRLGYDHSNLSNRQNIYTDQMRQNAHVQPYNPGSSVQRNGPHRMPGMNSSPYPMATQRDQFQHESQPMQHSAMNFNAQMQYGSASNNQQQFAQTQMYQNPNLQTQHQRQYQNNNHHPQDHYPSGHMQQNSIMNQVPQRSYPMAPYGAPQQYNENGNGYRR